MCITSHLLGLWQLSRLPQTQQLCLQGGSHKVNSGSGSSVTNLLTGLTSPVTHNMAWLKESRNPVKVLRVLVRFLQVYGSIPYTWSSSLPARRPELHLFWCLWTLLVNMVALCGVFTHVKTHEQFDVHNIGHLAYVITVKSRTFSTIISVLEMLYHSKDLAVLMYLLEKSLSSSEIYRKQRPESCICPKPKLIFLFTISLGNFATMFFYILKLDVSNAPEKVMLFMSSHLIIVKSSFVIIFLPWLLDYLGSDIRESAKTVVEAIKQGDCALTRCQDYGPTTHDKPSLLHLFSLERRIRKVG